ncbi:MAG: hypothetical protein QF619_12880, partial [Candidatus Binatia bacterium]|nr:hypothetical protein [Candidatus Binatia bacterium]
MNCEQLQEKLSEYLEWSLDRATDDAVESHLSACLICGGEAEALRQGIQSVADLPSVKPPPGFSQRIMAHVREEAQRPGLWECIVHPISIKIPIQATALILVGVLAVLVYRTNQPVERETV